MISTVLKILAVAFMVGVVFVLLRGLFNMMRGGPSQTSNKLMQARVALQLAAVVLVLLALWISQSGN